MRISRIEKARRTAAASRVPHVRRQLDLRGLARLLAVKNPDNEKQDLNPTQESYIFDPSRVTWFCGQAGAAKTTSAVIRTILPGLLYPGNRILIARWTYWTLEQSTMKAFDTMLAKLGPSAIVDEVKGPPRRVWIASGQTDAKGNPLEPTEVVFQGLDDFEKLGSLEFGAILVDEANEITREMATTLNLRLRHTLPGQDRPVGPFFLNLASNPVRRSHWLHAAFCNESDCDPSPMGKKFLPHPDENLQNLPPNYYEDATVGMPPEMIVRYRYGECGPDPSGKPVFPEFRGSLHIGDLKAVSGVPMGRGWDFGRRRPAVVWFQRLPNGHVNRLACELGDNEGTEAFVKRVLQRSMIEFPQAGGWFDVCDPHGTAKKSTSDESDIDIMNRLGLRPQFRDVGIERGLEAMSKGLCTLVQGRPRSMYDRVGCSLLIEGYQGGYTYAEPRPGHRLKEKPVADGFYEHLMDADRYIEVNLSMGSAVPAEQHARILRRIRPNSVTGW